MLSLIGLFFYGEGIIFIVAGLIGMYQIVDYWWLVGIYNYIGGWLIDQCNSYWGSIFLFGVVYE